VPGIKSPPTLTLILLGFPGVVETAQEGFSGPDLLGVQECQDLWGYRYYQVQLVHSSLYNLKKLVQRKELELKKILSYRIKTFS
jgi:hypothetical protein